MAAAAAATLGLVAGLLPGIAKLHALAGVAIMVDNIDQAGGLNSTSNFPIFVVQFPMSRQPEFTVIIIACSNSLWDLLP
jgi:hypothetical protein